MKGVMTIELKDLRFFAEHGIYEEEWKTGNEFAVDVLINYVAESVLTDINQTINYVEVYGLVKTEMNTRRLLLETCVMNIVEQIAASYPQSKKITVSMKKVVAPINNFMGSLGVSYTKEY